MKFIDKFKNFDILMLNISLTGHFKVKTGKLESFKLCLYKIRQFLLSTNKYLKIKS